MLFLLIVCLVKLIEMYSNNHKLTRNKCTSRNAAKENLMNSDKNDENANNKFSINYFYDIDQSCADQLKEFLQMKSGINSSSRGMTDNSTSQPATVNKLIKTGLLSHHQQSGFQPKPSLLKQPLSSLNTNHILNNNNNQNNNNYCYDKSSCCHQQAPKPAPRNVNAKVEQPLSLGEDALKNDIQIVLNNIQNALLNQQKLRQQQQQDQFYQHQDRFKHLNIFGGGGTSPSNDNQRNNTNNNNNNNLYLRKMSMSPAECDNTNNNNMLGCSFASDFTHDNSDYQWFVDYGYRDGVQHHSILSSLSASYNGIGELSYYDDLARNIDVNLAEVDIENFRSEDINSLLKIRQDENGVPRTLHLKDPTEIDNSICKSEILFSPVKESHISVDSLDNMLDGYPEDIILTCQANKNNYTIAFEGSCMYSDESYYDFPDNGRLKQNSINFDNALRHHNKKALQGDMTQSDTGFTTWSQLKKSSDHIHMHRYPSGNNNSNNNNSQTTNNCNNNNNNNIHISTCPHYFNYSVRKSSSMPNLKAILQQQLQNRGLNVSEVATTASQSSMDSEGSKIKTMLQNYAAPIASSESESPMPDNSSSNNEKIPAPSFNLVKLFIKQKSSSSDTCMDVSSGCWPSDSTNSSTEHPGNCSNSSLNRLRKKSMNDSGKFSALSKHEEDAEYQLDSLDAHMEGAAGERKTNDFNREIFDSPTHRRHYRESSLNIRNQMRNPLLYNVLNNNNNSSSMRSQSDGSRTSENLTQILLKTVEGGGGEASKATTIPIDMITKSIQTSTAFFPKTESTESKKLPQSHIKMVPPSFLSQLNKLGDHQQAPVYVIYPNYALPDLEFMNNPVNLKKDVIMSPMSYQAYHGQPKMTRTLDPRHQQKAVPPTRRRPQSLDIDRLGQNQYSHVQDWNSLLTLLPRDYKKLLKNIPEVNRITSMETSMSSQKPMFCMSPPIRRTTTGLICDCQTLFNNNQTVNSSSSGGSSTTQQPSSGYRGSSTLLTDSEMEGIINGSDAMKNMFVYQYDNVPELDQRPPTGRRGILRRTNTTTNTPTRVTSANVQKQKRYSMLDQPKSPQGQPKSEKRKSLQEANFYHHNDLEDYFNNIGGTKNFANRLPNYMKARDDIRNDSKDLNQLLTELELNKALSNKLNYEDEIDVDIEEIEARLKAESILNETVDRSKLRSEVSKNLTSRKVSFNHHPSPTQSPLKKTKAQQHLQAPEHEKKFTTPPNSPQMSQLVDKKQSPVDKKQRLEKEKQDKIQSNRFKRLQIQWELLSKEQESQVLETQSNVTTPTGLKCQSKIPRPVSYPNSKQTQDLSNLVGGKNLRSPSRMQAPKKYTTTPTSVTSPTSNMSATPRTPNKQLHTTPKKNLPARPAATRTR